MTFADEVGGAAWRPHLRSAAGVRTRRRTTVHAWCCPWRRLAAQSETAAYSLPLKTLPPSPTRLHKLWPQMERTPTW